MFLLELFFANKQNPSPGWTQFTEHDDVGASALTVLWKNIEFKNMGYNVFCFLFSVVKFHIHLVFLFCLYRFLRQENEPPWRVVMWVLPTLELQKQRSLPSVWQPDVQWRKWYVMWDRCSSWGLVLPCLCSSQFCQQDQLLQMPNP